MQGESVGLNSSDLGVVYVDVHHRGRLAGRITQREAGANSDHDVGGLHHIEKLVHLGSLPGGAETRAVRQRMAVRDGSLAARKRDHGYVCCFDQCEESLLRA